MTTATCPWYRRWFHRRARTIDVDVVFASLLEQSTIRAELINECDAVQFTDPIREEVHRAALAAFELHKQRPGNEHWSCACARVAEQMLWNRIIDAAHHSRRRR